MNAETNSADVAGHVARLQSELDVLSACIGEGEGDRPFSPQSAENVRGLVLDAHIDWLSGACLSVQSYSAYHSAMVGLQGGLLRASSLPRRLFLASLAIGFSPCLPSGEAEFAKCKEVATASLKKCNSPHPPLVARLWLACSNQRANRGWQPSSNLRPTGRSIGCGFVCTARGERGECGGWCDFATIGAGAMTAL